MHGDCKTGASCLMSWPTPATTLQPWLPTGHAQQSSCLRSKRNIPGRLTGSGSRTCRPIRSGRCVSSGHPWGSPDGASGPRFPRPMDSPQDEAAPEPAVPVDMIPLPLQDRLSRLHTKLGYAPPL